MSKPAIDVKKTSPTEQALFAYLDEMLREGTESAAAIEAVAEHVTPLDAPTEPPVVAPAPEASAILHDPAPLFTPLSITTSKEDVDDAPGLPPTTPWEHNGRPLWAQSRFDALIFKVAGLKLAVPLVALGLIHPIDKKFNALPHQTDWFLGLLRVQGGSIKVIDTAMCVMPERYTPACREGLKYVITLHGYDWGLACHEVEKAICLEPDTINWRTQRGKRPWMAGTVRDHMCALIDSAGFHNVIAAVERDKHLPLP